MGYVKFSFRMGGGKDFTVFYHLWRGSSFTTTYFKYICANSIEEIQGELEKQGIFGADIFCVLNRHPDDVLGD